MSAHYSHWDGDIDVDVDVDVDVVWPNADALLATGSQFQRSAHQVRSKGALVPRTNIQLRVGRLRPQLKIGVLHRVADSVDTCQEGSREKVLSKKVATA